MSTVSNVLVALPAKIRGRVYAGFSWAMLLVGATYIGFGTLGAEIPDWLNVTSAVLAFLATGVGWTAKANTPASDESPVDDGDTSTG